MLGILCDGMSRFVSLLLVLTAALDITFSEDIYLAKQAFERATTGTMKY